MKSLLEKLDQMQRPSLLIRAARHGVTTYCRDVHLRRLLANPPQHPAACLAQLMEVEATQDQARRIERADYRVAEHVQTLIAIMAEARVLRNSHASEYGEQPPAQNKRARAIQPEPA